MPFETLLDILKKAQRDYPSLSLRLAEAEALGRWERAVGEMIAKHARAIRVKDSTLWVEVDHPIWKSELHYRKNQILDILNGHTQVPHKNLPAPTEVLTDIVYLDPRPKTLHPRKDPFFSPTVKSRETTSGAKSRQEKP